MQARVGAGFSARALCRHVAMLAAFAILFAARSPAADLAPHEGGGFNPAAWEIRFGGLAHGVGGPESGTVDVNSEFVVPIIPHVQSAAWSFLVPRLHAGTNVNTAGRTNLFYTGLLWTVPLIDRFFVEGFLDAAVHDGSLTGSHGHAALGCRALVHAGGSIGYRIDSRWSVMLTFDHASNGAGMGLSDCVRNQGLNGYGARVGFSF